MFNWVRRLSFSLLYPSSSRAHSLSRMACVPLVWESMMSLVFSALAVLVAQASVASTYFASARPAFTALNPCTFAVCSAKDLFRLAISLLYNCCVMPFCAPVIAAAFPANPLARAIWTPEKPFAIPICMSPQHPHSWVARPLIPSLTEVMLSFSWASLKPSFTLLLMPF